MRNSGSFLLSTSPKQCKIDAKVDETTRGNRLDLLDRRLTRGIWSVSRSPVDATDDHAAGSHSVGAVHAPTQALVKATCTCSGGNDPFPSTWPQLDMPRRSVSQHLAWTSPLHFNLTGTQASKGARVLDAEVGAPV